jgi:hypothetical protein
MIGKLERGSVATVCEVKPHEGGFRGRLSIPGWGTKFTDVYPDKDDALVALVDLRREALPSLSEASRAAVAPIDVAA